MVDGRKRLRKGRPRQGLSFMGFELSVICRTIRLNGAPLSFSKLECSGDLFSLFMIGRPDD